MLEQVMKDQPALTKKIVERWVLDRPFEAAGEI